MSKSPAPPPISLEGVHALEQVCLVAPETQEVPDDDHNPIAHRWDWRFVGKGEFQVRLGLRIGPVVSRPEFLQVLMVGRFRMLDLMELPAVSQFAATNAAATLVPHIRSALATLSMRGPFGAYHLPLLNVISLAEDFEEEEAEGWRQAQEDPDLLSPSPIGPEAANEGGAEV